MLTNSTATSRGFTRLALIGTIAVGLAFTNWPIAPIDVAAQDDGNSRVCSNYTLRGDYGLQAEGIRQVPPFLGGGSEQFNATGMWRFHGDGTFSGLAGGNLHGLVTGNSTIQSDYPGTYSVNADCTGTMALYPPDLPFPIQYAIVIVANAREIKGIVTSATSLTTVSLTRK